MTVTTTTAGRVVTAAGMVFAFTMASMIVSSFVWSASWVPPSAWG
jgi:uncharacterized membrane protein YdfJ with MMPL/SSD domain